MDPLQQAIDNYIRRGYYVVHQTETSAQLRRPKRFSCFWASVWLVACGVGFLFYVFYWASKSDDSLYLRLDEYGELFVDGRGQGQPKQPKQVEPPAQEVYDEYDAYDRAPALPSGSKIEAGPALAIAGGIGILALLASPFVCAFLFAVYALNVAEVQPTPQIRRLAPVQFEQKAGTESSQEIAISRSQIIKDFTDLWKFTNWEQSQEEGRAVVTGESTEYPGGLLILTSEPGQDDNLEKVDFLFLSPSSDEAFNRQSTYMIDAFVSSVPDFPDRDQWIRNAVATGNGEARVGKLRIVAGTEDVNGETWVALLVEEVE